MVVQFQIIFLVKFGDNQRDSKAGHSKGIGDKLKTELALQLAVASMKHLVDNEFKMQKKERQSI